MEFSQRRKNQLFSLSVDIYLDLYLSIYILGNYIPIYTYHISIDRYTYPYIDIIDRYRHMSMYMSHTHIHVCVIYRTYHKYTHHIYHIHICVLYHMIYNIIYLYIYLHIYDISYIGIYYTCKYLYI